MADKKPKNLVYSDADYAAILKGIGAPVNERNLSVMRAWRTSEGGTYANNPFNTTRQFGNSWGGGVQRYRNRPEGLTATVKTINEDYYDKVRQALQNSNPMNAMKAIINSPWAGGHYGVGQGGNWKDSYMLDVYRNQNPGGIPGMYSQETTNKALAAGASSQGITPKALNILQTGGIKPTAIYPTGYVPPKDTNKTGTTPSVQDQANNAINDKITTGFPALSKQFSGISSLGKMGSNISTAVY